MSYDKHLADRIRSVLKRRKGITERKMFGGICFFVDGKMIGGPTGTDKLAIRVGPERYESALQEPHAREMDFTGRPLRGFVYVDESGYETDESLKEWIDAGLAHARSLPPKMSADSG